MRRVRFIADLLVIITGPRVGRLPAAKGLLLCVRGLGVELGAQPPGLALSAAGAPLGALGTAGGPSQRGQALGRALLLGVRETLAVCVVGELGELMHDGHLLPVRDRLVLSPTVASGPGGHHT
jgi:hypothetical protein